MIELDGNLLAAAGFMALGGFLRGFLGFGGSMAAVPGLSLIYGPLGAVSIVLLLAVAVFLRLATKYEKKKSGWWKFRRFKFF